MTAEEMLSEVYSILDYYMNDTWSGYRELLSISNGEGGCFNNDWEAEAFYTCQKLIELLGLEPPESESELRIDSSTNMKRAMKLGMLI